MAYKRKKRVNREKEIQKLLTQYVLLKYAKYKPMVFSDLAGVNLSPAQRQEYKNRSNDSYPDFMIFEPRNGYSGLMLELKKEDTKLYKKDGTPKTEHIAKQHKTLERLRERGFYAFFGVGLENSINIIDHYFTFNENEEKEETESKNSI